MARSRNLRQVVAALAALSVLVASCGDSSSSDSGGQASPATPPPVGAAQHVRANGTTLVVAIRKVTFPLRGSGAVLSPGDAAAGVDVSVKNLGPGVYDSSSESDVRLHSSSGEFAGPAFAVRGPCAGSEIDFLKLVQPGESRSGCVTFDLPRGTQPDTVRFEPGGRPRGGRTWLVTG